VDRRALAGGVAAATISRASATVSASGFSQRTCLPASIAATDTLAWTSARVATVTAAISSRSNMASVSLYVSTS